MLTFNESEHKYFWNGAAVPGVTSLLAPLNNFNAVPRNVLEAACFRGKAVHSCCEWHDLGELDESTVDAEWLPYLDAWRAFRSEHTTAWELIESPVYHHTLGYAGTLDRFGTVSGVSAVLDIKTSTVIYPSVGPQLSAYLEALKTMIIDIRKTDRITVQLGADGKYKITKHKNDAADWSVFLSCLTIHNYLRNQ